ncbi:MAG: hypothetical protein HFH60_07735 [Lachnospiraceae bacterium]|nr:hypothetical protein [Lachnospiraceae bacterium]
MPRVELVLRIITDKRDLVIAECEAQKDMKYIIFIISNVPEWMRPGI